MNTIERIFFRRRFSLALAALLLVFSGFASPAYAQDTGSTMVPYSIGLRLRDAPNTSRKKSDP